MIHARASSSTRLLLLSGLCFVGLTLNNVILFVDLVVLSAETSLILLRRITTLASVLLLITGLIQMSPRSCR